MKKRFGLLYFKSYLAKLKFGKNSRSIGYVEMISPNLISGWVLDKKIKFVEVRLIDDNKVLASAPINIFRRDVTTKFNYKNPTGFNIEMNLNLDNEKILNPKLIAIDASAKRVFEIKLTFKNEILSDKLKDLLNSKFLNCNARINRIADDGQLIGWGFNQNNYKKIHIWMHSNSNQPVKVECNLSLYKLPLSDFNEYYDGLPLDCGINLNLKTFKNLIEGEELIFSFDEEGNYPIKSERRLIIPDFSRSSKKTFFSKANDNFYNFLCSTENLENNSNEKEWFPWRIISCLTKTNDLDKSSDKYFKLYEKNFHDFGSNTIESFSKIDYSIIKDEIIDYFDPVFYSNYPDMANSSEDEMLTHFSIHGGYKNDRKPNSMFDIEKFQKLYPWVKQIKINPFFLFIKWHEQFPEFKNLLLKRFKVLKNEPFSRDNFSWTLQDSIGKKEPNFISYKRILYLVNKHSSIQRRIKSNKQSLEIHFLIPDFSKGGGGHMTIFRLIKHLEKLGHKVTIWIKDYLYSNHPQGPLFDIKKYFQDISSDVFQLNTHFSFAKGDALIATSWDTVEIVEAHKSFIDKFYLVQDFEPMFYPKGSKFLKSEQTYQKDLKTICASKWLDKTMRENYGKKSCYFDLSYNHEIFSCNKQKTDSDLKLRNKDVIRIAFYGRKFTDRRAVELALEGLEELARYEYNICLEIFGIEKNILKLPDGIEGIDNGVLSPFELSKLYEACDIGIALSATNYSLVPPEMMASGLPVLELLTESNKIIYPENVVKFAESSPKGIASAINSLIQNDSERKLIIKTAYNWVSNTSWEKSFNKVEKFIKEEVLESNIDKNLVSTIYERYENNQYEKIKSSKVKNCLVSIVVPTFNGGELLIKCVKKLCSQKVDFNFEILLIDSSSTDNSIINVEKDERISIYKINQSDFQHGKTRNLAVTLSKGEYIAFLTQDAIPSNQDWLKNIILPLVNDKEVCAVFGRHISHENHTELSKRAMDSFFEQFQKTLKYRYDDDLIKFFSENPSYRQYLHYYSDNNSCLRKSIWEEFPYHDVDYGEDQLWADWVINSGKTKAFANNAVVFHSHEYSVKEEFERSRIESNFFFKYFGYDISQNRFELEVGLQNEAKQFLNEWKLFYKNDNKINKNHQLDLMRAKREGFILGVNEAISEIEMGS